MRFAFTSKDRGWNALRKTVASLEAGETTVKAGVLQDKAARSSADGETIDNVELAVIHEFGAPTRGIPERSFIRAPFADHRKGYQAILVDVLKKMIERGDREILRKGLNVIGLKMAADMRNRITDGEGIPPPNSPRTIARKGSSRPLVDTGQLRRSITHAVEMD